MSGWAHDVACCWSIRESGACAYDDGAVERNHFSGTNRPCPERSNKDDEVIAHGVRPHLSKPQKETQQRARWHILCPSEEHRLRFFAPALLFEISPPKSQCAGVRYPTFSPFLAQGVDSTIYKKSDSQSTELVMKVRGTLLTIDLWRLGGR
jgi:hypothetical protein